MPELDAEEADGSGDGGFRAAEPHEDPRTEEPSRAVEAGKHDEYDAVCFHLAEEATELAARMVRSWEDIGAHEPWLALPEGIDLDHLPELIETLAEAARWRMERLEDRERIVRLGARHGEGRASAGYGEELLFREYHLLRRTLWDELRREWGAGAETYAAILQIDAGITLSSSASLHGYHRAQYEERGDWPDPLDHLLDRWPTLG